jgi:post-segregation antitoxin (ccd killing protein)
MDHDVVDELTLYARESGRSRSEAIREAWLQAREAIRQESPRSFKKKKYHNVTWDADAALDLRTYCAAHGVTLSRAVQEAWRVARTTIKQLPVEPSDVSTKQPDLPKKWKRYNIEKRASVYLSKGMWDAIRAYAASKDITVSPAIARAWHLARKDIKALPSPPIRIRHHKLHKVSPVYVPTELVDEARRTGLSVAAMVALVWERSRDEIRALGA